MILRHDLLCQILRKFKLGIFMGEKPKNLKVKILKKYLTTASRDIIRNLWLEFHPDLDPDRIRVKSPLDIHWPLEAKRGCRGQMVAR